ncbi:S-layer glycoprotein N-glycosyltransferase AglJ [Natronobacterium gregoryi]|uniref:Family 2 glycosyl transferase n=2 Tax=Natronobacterium gregoryi TaxID=44930 RepID=L0AHL7_NATGS|nr:S-layer glycoprotein N-glycosyltransferase AglJ [Natronobacterium gregoryi]AFZ73403.1 glycosyltransferase, TIGR04182 family [Natronobacterium gregoryi SP2]ELY68599.1 family 2 glycosyl transferase [Natronobacterium gregoryi SP2]PLK19680.1 TIGR04182 family glycosyltransferase [Natronobacterium gregoryi SP2]SFI72961.1 dolichol-phosphate mannosyltransferase [Natronobacterium gregoryi]
MENDGTLAHSDRGGEVIAMSEAETTREISSEEVCVLIPTLDEAATVGDVIDGFHEQGYGNVVVIDGGSEDDTQEIAREHGATVLVQSGDGKGQAVREAVDYIDVPYVLMLDGDGTYDPTDAETMLEPLSRGYEHVIGNRFADMDDDAMRALNGFGNRMINRSFRFIHGADYDDILSGYRAFTADSFERLSLDSDGFTIETELAVECVKHGIDTTVVPISYSARPEESETNLHPIRDGGTIILALYSLAKTNNPLFYFGSLGVSGIAAGGVVAAYVLWQWVQYGQGHEILAVVAAAGILLGVQLLMFGVLSDMFVTLHREQRRRLEQITRERREAGETDDDR